MFKFNSCLIKFKMFLLINIIYYKILKFIVKLCFLIVFNCYVTFCNYI